MKAKGSDGRQRRRQGRGTGPAGRGSTGGPSGRAPANRPSPNRPSSGRRPAGRGSGTTGSAGFTWPFSLWPSVGLVLVVVAVAIFGSIQLLGGGASATASPGGSSALAGPSGSHPACPSSQPPALTAGQTRTVTIATPKGTIVLAIKADLSPIAAGNFVALASCGYYDGVIFHRLVPGFVIQGGDGQYGRVEANGKVTPANLASVGQGGPGYTIQDEPVTAQYARGVVAMARSTQPNSVGSQFFIVLSDAAKQSLATANTYQIIGTVTSGMDVVDAIAAMPNSGDPDNLATDPVPMTSVTVGP